MQKYKKGMKKNLNKDNNGGQNSYTRIENSDQVLCLGVCGNVFEDVAEWRRHTCKEDNDENLFEGDEPKIVCQEKRVNHLKKPGIRPNEYSGPKIPYEQ
jgi:hypothetical protein